MTIEPILTASPTNQNTTVLRLTNHTFIDDFTACESFLKFAQSLGSGLNDLGIKIDGSALSCVLVIDCPYSEFEVKRAAALIEVLKQLDIEQNPSYQPKVDPTPVDYDMDM